MYKQPSIHNYAVINGYLKNQKGMLKIRKWVDRKEQPEYADPNVSFTLTRKYKKKDGSWVKDSAFSEIKYLNYKEFKYDKMGEITFGNLAIYAPNGNKYEYTITENANGFIQGGYEVAGGKGLWEETDDKLFTFKDEITGLYPIKEVEGQKEPEWDINSSVTYKNIYTNKDKAPLTLRKWWNDRHNFAGLRGKSLTLDFYRRADAQSSKPEDNNKIPEEKIGTIKLTVPDEFWYEEFYDKEVSPDKRHKEVKVTGQYQEGSEKLKKMLGDNPQVKIQAVTSNLAGQNKGDNGQWDITFESKFEMYAPNGMPWIYRLAEKVEEPYKVKETSGRDFYYDKGKNCFTSGKGNSFTNVLEVTRAEIYKLTKDSENLSKPLINRTGYEVQLTAKLYVAATTNKEERDKLTNWKCVEDSEYGAQIDAFSNQRNPGTEQGPPKWNKFSKKWTFGRNGMLGADGNGSYSYYRCHDLPVKIKTANGETVYFRYAFVETGLEFKDESGKTVYQEDFELKTEIVTDEYDNNKQKVGYWLEPTAKIWNGNALVSTKEIWFRPLFNTSEKLKSFCSKQSNFRKELKEKGLWNDSFAYPFLATKTPDGIVGQTERNDMYNLVDTKKLHFEKIWKDDNHNEFGTRAPVDSNTWEVSFMIQQKGKKENSDWENCPESVYKPNPVRLSGKNEEDSAGMDVDGLPAQSLVQKEDGSYEFLEYEYRAREVNTDNKVIENNGLYHESYQAQSEDLTSGTPDADYYSRVTNTMEVTERFAEKRWDNEKLTVPVTFELKYQRDTDNSWVSFKTPAKVVLDGNVDENATSAYLEYEPWKAKWTGVPKKMPGSVKDKDGNTIYRIVEITDSSYEITEGTKGTGTEEKPYVLKDMDSKGTEKVPVVYQNSLTELKVEKRIDRPEGAELSSDEKDKEFTFTIDGLIPGKTYSYRKFTKAASTGQQDIQEGEAFVLTSEQNSFTLKDNQYVIIYGLEKGKTYIVKEEAAENYEVFYESFGVQSEHSSEQKETGEITIPETKPDTTPTITAVNKRFGMIVIEKKTGDHKPLDGVVFELQYKEKTDPESAYKPADETVCKNPLIVNPPAESGLKKAQVKTGTVTVHGEEKTGCAVFDRLMLGYDYRIVEVSVPQGYNKLDKPLELSLPYEISKENQTGKTKPFYEMEGKHYYSEVTLLIENNTGITMPITSGSGSFPPGIIGVLLVGAAGIWYVIREEKKRRATKK